MERAATFEHDRDKVKRQFKVWFDFSVPGKMTKKDECDLFAFPK